MVQLDPVQVEAWVRLLPGLPFLLFAVLAASPRLPAKWPGAVLLAPYARAASPLALTVLLLVLSSLIVARGGLAVGVAGIVLGVFGYGFRSTLLLVRTEGAARRMHELARIDALTGVPNRRGFDEAAAQAWRDAAHQRQPLAVMMIDIDHFKVLNDRFGHTLGDDCLRLVARTLADAMSDAPGMVARVGGEEFAAMLPGMGIAAAAQLAERMRAAVQAAATPLPDAAFPLTVSIGLATAQPDDDAGPKPALILADRMLYEAKRSGRNRVCTAGAATPST
jgi:diguanylate cyclase (GGDEF)-like protein